MWKATISPEKRKKIRRSVSFFLSLLLILEMVSGTGMFAEGNRVKAKEETPYAVYLDLSGSSTAEALASKGIYAYAYDDAAEAEVAEPVKLEKAEGQQEIWQLGLTRKYRHVVFSQGQQKENKNTTGELTIDWSLQAPCYRLQGEDLTGTGSFYGLYTVYFDGSQYSEFCKNGVSIENGTIKATYSGNATSEVLTDENGTATFSDLDLGFYVVIETTVPDAVTTAMDPFLLSVPMTTTDGTGWLYDIHVYPKNETGYGKISLEKTGVNGEKIPGAEFALQKRTATGWDDITKKSTAQGDNTGADLILKTDASGLITIDGLSKGEYRLIETSVGNGYIMDGATAYEFTVNANKKITYKGVESANTKIEVTNERPDLTKEVQKKNGGTWGRDADYSIGDEIPYKITVNVPNNITKLKTFTVTDTPTNLKDDLSSIKITCSDPADHRQEEKSRVIQTDNSFVISSMDAAKLL